jgi:predicted nucleic acid-binding protein
VYAVDPAEQDRARIASELLERLTSLEAAVVSTQIVSEYYDAVVRPGRRAAPLLTTAQATASIDRILGSILCLDITAAIVREAVRATSAHQMRIFDALVWATAKLASVPLIISEDVPRRQIEGVAYANPFAPDFSLARIGL